MKPPIILNTTEHTSRPGIFSGNQEVQCCVRFNVQSGSSSAVERQLPKLDVAGSIPVSRSSLQQPTRFDEKLISGVGPSLPKNLLRNPLA